MQGEQGCASGLFPGLIVPSQLLLKKEVEFGTWKVCQDRLPSVLVSPKPDAGRQTVRSPLLKLGRSLPAKDPGGEQSCQADGDRRAAVRARLCAHRVPEGLIMVASAHVALILKQPRQACARTAKVLEDVQGLGDKLIGGRQGGKGKARPGMSCQAFPDAGRERASAAELPRMRSAVRPSAAVSLCNDP